MVYSNFLLSFKSTIGHIIGRTIGHNLYLCEFRKTTTLCIIKTLDTNIVFILSSWYNIGLKYHLISVGLYILIGRTKFDPKKKEDIYRIESKSGSRQKS